MLFPEQELLVATALFCSMLFPETEIGSAYLMAWTEMSVGNGRESVGAASENECLKGLASSSDAGVPPTQVPPLKKIFEGKDVLSYANILRSRNKFPDALVLYDSVLEKDGTNVEALIGKGICLQMRNMTRQAFESFMEAVRLDPQNACAFTHCGVIYKDEGHLIEAAEVKFLSHAVVPMLWMSDVDMMISHGVWR